MEKVVGFTYNKHRYIYQRNIQGDIIRIYDVETDEVVAEYSYDAWGNQNVKNKNEDNIGDISPIRYRGYYYDNETGLYYLNARYYDPKLGRFISPDTFSVLDDTMGEINGLNLYMYCKDNPVMYADPSGCFALTVTALVWIAFGVSALVGATASVISQEIATDWQHINVLQVIWDAGIAGIGGALSMSPLGWGAMIAANTALGFVGSVGGHLIQGHDLFGENSGEYWTDIGISTLIGLGIGIIGGPGAQRGMNIKALQQNFISAYDDMLATGTKVASSYYKTAGMAAIHMNKATAKCGAAFLMYSSAYANMLSSITWSIYKSSIVTLGTSWRTAVMQ